jgi:hypothetical protein
VFGEDVDYTPSGASEPTTIKGIFTSAYVEVEGVVTLKPILRINLEDLSSDPGKGDTVDIDDVTYKVVESRVDGNGGTTLILQKA